VLIIWLATFLRVYRLDQLPPGLHHDEAFKVVEARQVITGDDRPIFFTGNFGEEPMMIYATALAFTLFGETPWALRLVSGFTGILTVAALYALARELFRSRWVAALAALALAILYWHLDVSRLGFQEVLTPLMLTLSFVFLWRGLTVTLHPPILHREGQRWGYFALGGFFLGATLYTYRPALFAPPLVAVALGIELLIDRGFWTHNRTGLIIFALVAVLVFAPLGLYFASHPGDLLERPSSVIVMTSPGTQTLLDNTIKVAGMFFVRGDENPRANLPGRPALDPFLALGFIAGLIACAVEIRRPASRWLLLWLGVMVLPSVVTDFAPHFGRTISAIPPMILIVAYGFRWLSEKIRAPQAALVAILMAGLTTSAYSTVRDYFGVWANDPGLFDAFDVGLLSLARDMRAQPVQDALYLSPVNPDAYTVEAGLAGRAAHFFDGRDVLVLPPPPLLPLPLLLPKTWKSSQSGLPAGGRWAKRIFANWASSFPPQCRESRCSQIVSIIVF
jgi:4-amino-4-deoxy-L-arabinose transferase-like glycosyltransferase